MLYTLAVFAACTPGSGAPGPVDAPDPTAPTVTVTDGADTDTASTATGDTGDGTSPPAPSDRDRLFSGYFAYLQRDPTYTPSNGVRGADVADVCALWDALDPSTQAVFLTITARLDGSILVADGSSMLSHVLTANRIAGGTGSSMADPGDCGGDGNRLFLTMDATLHAALVAAGTSGPGVIDDLPAGGHWHDSSDLAGPHDPFDASDETEDGAPRGQVHFFADPASAVANAPLGRTDVAGLVDPYALEMDQDYDCVHNSNPACEYTFYGPLCAPEPRALGATIFTDHYGSFDPTWRPAGC